MSDLADRIAEMDVIRPGDALVIRLNQPAVSQQEIDGYRAMLAELVPGVAVVFVQAEQAFDIRPGSARSATDSGACDAAH